MDDQRANRKSGRILERVRLVALLGLVVSLVVISLTRVDRVSKGLASPSEQFILVSGIWILVASICGLIAAAIIGAIDRRLKK